jgi:hypothetical protein
MWYRLAVDADKQRPVYELKVLAMDAEYAIRRLCYLQQNYNPSQLEVSRKVKKILSHLENKYGSIANVRLYTEGSTLQDLVSENVQEVFGKKQTR